MKILVGSLGDLGYLVKPIPAREGEPAWRRFEDEASLLGHLRDLSFSETAIRGIVRSVRAEGRAIVSLGTAETESRAPLRSRPSPARASAPR